MAGLYDALTQRMDYLVARQNVIAGNIANANTPGYLSRDLVTSAESSPAATFAMKLTQAGHIAIQPTSGEAAGTIVEDKRFIEHNGNSVRLDNETLKMNQTQLEYRMMTELYAKQVAMQKMAMGSRQ